MGEVSNILLGYMAFVRRLLGLTFSRLAEISLAACDSVKREETPAILDEG
jgi:hypothetical protein